MTQKHIPFFFFSCPFVDFFKLFPLSYKPQMVTAWTDIEVAAIFTSEVEIVCLIDLIVETYVTSDIILALCPCFHLKHMIIGASYREFSKSEGSVLSQLHFDNLCFEFLVLFCQLFLIFILLLFFLLQILNFCNIFNSILYCDN